MLKQLRKRVPELLKLARLAKWHASDVAWNANWRVLRAAATPWARPQYEAARAKLAGTPVAQTVREARAATVAVSASATAAPGSPPGAPGSHAGLVVERARLDEWLRDAAPPGVPYEVAVLPGSELRQRFGDGPMERRSLHLIGKLRMTHRAIPSQAVVVIVLFSDVAADYFVESMAADVASRVNEEYGEGAAFSDSQANVPVILKEVATAAGLGSIGKNALFYSPRFGFNCKLNVVFLNAPVDRYDATPVGEEWKLADCSTCNLCVEACPVGAFDDYVITKTESCDRLIAGDFFGPRRDHMCRACITRCPVSNDVLKLRRKEGTPKRTFWDNEAQLALVADLFMYKPSFVVWLIQRFYYGSGMPGRGTDDKKKGYTEALTAAANVSTSDQTRDGWRLATRRRR
jgi:ferredoxin